MRRARVTAPRVLDEKAFFSWGLAVVDEVLQDDKAG